MSTAYYAVFHAITSRVAGTVFPAIDTNLLGQVRRWIRHGDVRIVCEWVARTQGTIGGRPPAHIAVLTHASGAPAFVDAIVGTVSDGFLELIDKREQADYDHSAIFTRADTRGHIALARSLVSAVESTDTDASRCFFGLIAMKSEIRNR